MPPRKRASHSTAAKRVVVDHPQNNLFDQLAEVDEGGVNLFYLSLVGFMFILIVFFQPDSFSHSRWQTSLDLNRNGAFTASDLMMWMIWIFSMPGDIFVQLFMLSKPLAKFFELTPRSFGQPVSIGLSLIYWWLTGGKRMVIFWLFIIVVAVFSNLPPLPLPR